MHLNVAKIFLEHEGSVRKVTSRKIENRKFVVSLADAPPRDLARALAARAVARRQRLKAIGKSVEKSKSRK